MTTSNGVWKQMIPDHQQFLSTAWHCCIQRELHYDVTSETLRPIGNSSKRAEYIGPISLRQLLHFTPRQTLTPMSRPTSNLQSVRYYAFYKTNTANESFLLSTSLQSVTKINRRYTWKALQAAQHADDQKMSKTLMISSDQQQHCYYALYQLQTNESHLFNRQHKAATETVT